jgi:hypothetical protein
MISRRTIALALVSLAALAGCKTTADADNHDADERPAAAQPATEDAAVRVEQAERALDVGRDVPAARAALQAVLADKTTCSDVRDRAALALSRACEMLKDSDGAVAAVEALLAEHAGDRSWPGQEAAERRLRKLLTGKEEGPPSSHHADEKVAPFARLLAANYFHAKKDQPVDISILGFGANAHQSASLGTFNIGDALHQLAEEACPLCDTKINARTTSSWSGSWTAIPAEKGRMGTSLTVFYTHLADPIPARYDSLLPAPMAEVLPHLQKGEGLIVAKDRPGAPPVLLIAAPREAQLADVEEALSQMKALPASPSVVKLSAQLKADEIRSAVRSTGMPAFKKCYESLLSRSPSAAGKADIAFSIKGDGSIDDIKIDTTEGLSDGAFQRCMTGATSPIRFPASGQTTTVKYPVEFAP